MYGSSFDILHSNAAILPKHFAELHMLWALFGCACCKDGPEKAKAENILVQQKSHPTQRDSLVGTSIEPTLGSCPVPAPHLSAIPSEAFTVILADRTKKVGADFWWSGQDGMIIKAINANGLLMDWNSSNPGRIIEEGFLVKSVNGKRGLLEMTQEFASTEDHPLELVIQPRGTALL
eukprot:2300005-Amphidinium_carterae.1